MRRITFGGASFVTTDRIADALVSLLGVLNIKQRSAVALIPVVFVDGTVVTAKLFLAPASSLISVPEESSWPEPDAADAVTNLQSLEEAASSPSEIVWLETIAVADDEWSDPDLDDL